MCMLDSHAYHDVPVANTALAVEAPEPVTLADLPAWCRTISEPPGPLAYKLAWHSLSDWCMHTTNLLVHLPLVCGLIMGAQLELHRHLRRGTQMVGTFRIIAQQNARTLIILNMTTR